MKKNRLFLLFATLVISSFSYANNRDVSTDVKKPVEITIDNGGYNNGSNDNNNKGGTTIPTNPNRRSETISNSAGTIRIDTSYTSQGQDYRQKFIILHYTAGNRDSSLKTLTKNEVSAHYMVSDNKSEPIYSLVDENKRALERKKQFKWHFSWNWNCKWWRCQWNICAI